MRTKLLHKIEHQLHRHHFILFVCLLASFLFWYVGLEYYGQAKALIREARETYTTLSTRITEEKSVINEFKTYCSGGLQTIIAPMPELPNALE